MLNNLLNWIELHPGAAAWVQAIGALIALFVAIFVPIWMARSAERLNRHRFLASVAAIGAEAQECFANAAMKCGGGEEEGRFFVQSVDAFHRFRIVSAAINSIPIHQLPSYRLTRSVLDLQQMVAESLMLLDAAVKEIEAHTRLVQVAAYGTAFSRLAERAHPHLKQIEGASAFPR